MASNLEYQWEPNMGTWIREDIRSNVWCVHTVHASWQYSTVSIRTLPYPACGKGTAWREWPATQVPAAWNQDVSP